MRPIAPHIALLTARPSSSTLPLLRLQRLAVASALAAVFGLMPSLVPGGATPALAQGLSQGFSIDEELDAERAGDMEEAERAFGGSNLDTGADRGEPGIPSPNVLDQMMEQGAAVAQFTCTVKETAIYGISAMGRRGGAPIDMDVTLAETGVAIVNGQAIQPTETRTRTLGAGGATIESALYPMEEVRRALTGPAYQLPSTGFSSDEQRQLEGFGGILNGMMDGLTAGRNRHMLITLSQNSVGFFDIAAGNRVANAQTASCFRVQ